MSLHRQEAMGNKGARHDFKAMKPVIDDIQLWKLIGAGDLTVVGFGGMDGEFTNSIKISSP